MVSELEARSALASAVRVYLLLSRFAKSQAVVRLLEITEGGVGQREQAEFNQVVAELRELAQPCLELDVFWGDAGKELL